MKLRTLVLEGDKEAERKAREEHLPARTKSEYLRRKRREGLPPLFQRGFYLCRMIEEELKGLDLDGSGQITVCAHNDRRYPGEEPYICDRGFHISIYYTLRKNRLQHPFIFFVCCRKFFFVPRKVFSFSCL